VTKHHVREKVKLLLMPLFLINFCLDMYLTVAPPLHNSGRYQDFEFIQATIRSGGKPPIFTLFMTYSFDLMQQSNDFVTKPRSVQEYTLESIKDGTLCFLEIGTMVSETSKSVTFSLVSFVVSFESCPQKRPIRKPKFQDEFLVTRFLIFFIIITANSRREREKVLLAKQQPKGGDCHEAPNTPIPKVGGLLYTKHVPTYTLTQLTPVPAN